MENKELKPKEIREQLKDVVEYFKKPDEEQRDDELIEQYKKLNKALYLAYQHDPEKQIKYKKELDKAQTIGNGFNNVKLDEDSEDEKILIPKNKKMEEYVKEIKNVVYPKGLIRTAEEELKQMNLEAELYKEVIKALERKDFDQICKCFCEIKEGYKQYGDYCNRGKEINTERFKKNYPKTFKRLIDDINTIEKKMEKDKGINL